MRSNFWSCFLCPVAYVCELCEFSVCEKSCVRQWIPLLYVAFFLFSSTSSHQCAEPSSGRYHRVKYFSPCSPIAAHSTHIARWTLALFLLTFHQLGQLVVAHTVDAVILLFFGQHAVDFIDNHLSSFFPLSRASKAFDVIFGLGK